MCYTNDKLAPCVSLPSIALGPGEATVEGSSIGRRAKSSQPIDERALRIQRHQEIELVRPDLVTYALSFQGFVGCSWFRDNPGRRHTIVGPP